MPINVLACGVGGLAPGATQLKRRLFFISLAPALLAIIGSDHTTSQLALLGSTVVLGIAMVRPTRAHRLMQSAWLVATLLVVPLALLLFALRLDTVPWLFQSAQERIVIWGHTSEQVAKRQLLGVGINSARVAHEQERERGPQGPSSPFKLHTAAHSHNGYLQTWYEAGAVGVAFLLGIGLLMLGALAKEPQEAQPYLLATFASCALVGGLSFSLWQPWFMASFGFAALFAGLSLERLEQQRS